MNILIYFSLERQAQLTTFKLSHTFHWTHTNAIESLKYTFDLHQSDRKTKCSWYCLYQLSLEFFPPPQTSQSGNLSLSYRILTVCGPFTGSSFDMHGKKKSPPINHSVPSFKCIEWGYSKTLIWKKLYKMALYEWFCLLVYCQLIKRSFGSLVGNVLKN